MVATYEKNCMSALVSVVIITKTAPRDFFFY